MKAAQIAEYGDDKVVTVNEVPKPQAQEGQVVVEVYSSSLNPFDAKVRAGFLQKMVPLKFPATLGGDIAGVVTEVGTGVTGVKVGERVFGQANVVAGNSGALAEYAATAASQIAKAPDGLDLDEAASLPLVGVSAMQALTEHLELKPGQKIFITGGAGGIGTMAIQIAKHMGAFVATTAGTNSLDFVRELGADKVIDYKQADFAAQLHDYDAVFDTVGGSGFDQTLAVLKRGGRAVTMAGKADEAKADELRVVAMSQSTRVTTEALDQLRELVLTGAIKPQVAKVFPLARIQEAFKWFDSSSVHGKVVIRIK